MARTSLSQVLGELLAEKQTSDSSYTLRNLAAYLEISPASLSQILSGKRHVGPKLFKRLSEKLGKEIDERYLLSSSLLPDWVAQHRNVKKALGLWEGKGQRYDRSGTIITDNIFVSLETFSKEKEILVNLSVWENDSKTINETMRLYPLNDLCIGVQPQTVFLPITESPRFALTTA